MYKTNKKKFEVLILESKKIKWTLWYILRV